VTGPVPDQKRGGKHVRFAGNLSSELHRATALLSWQETKASQGTTPGRGGGGEGTATCAMATHGSQHLQTAPGFSQLQLKRETSEITAHITTLV